MLSRAASSLFWMARYLERAESIARLLDVSLTAALMETNSDREQQLIAPLTISGTTDTFYELYDDLTAQNLIDFLLLNDQHGGSVYSCIRSARDNAHHVRGNITADVWESINSSWLDMKAIRQRGVSESSVSRFFDWVKERSHLFRGASYGTLLRNDAFRFLRLGTFIERADNTARILDAHYHLSTSQENTESARDLFEWTALLHALGAYEAYQSIYADRMSSENVAELLILNPDVPRSLRACLHETAELLAHIEGDAGRAAKRLATSLSANLRYGDRQYITDRGLHDYLTDFLARINQIADQIQNDYMGVA